MLLHFHHHCTNIAISLRSQGSCVDSHCVCNKGFIGPTCTPFCTGPQNCSNHGHCVNLQCECNAGYSGPRCAATACPLACRHGGRPNVPNASCTFCLGCAVGWGGANCSAWNASVLPQLPAFVHAMAQKATEVQAALQAEFHILPGSVGWGANVQTGQLTLLPVLDFTYRKNKTWGSFTVPAEAIITPYPAAGNGVVNTAVYQTFGDIENARARMNAANQGQAGALFSDGGDLAHVNEAFRSDFAYTAVRDAFPAYTLTLPVDPVTNQYELAMHLRGQAGKRQVEGAKIGLAHVIGLGTCCGIHILEGPSS